LRIWEAEKSNKNTNAFKRAGSSRAMERGAFAEERVEWQQRGQERVQERGRQTLGLACGRAMPLRNGLLGLVSGSGIVESSQTGRSMDIRQIDH
jgi:hypothetical protein